MSNNALVVDANILVRAVLGKRVRAVIEEFAESASFFVPDVAYAEAEEHLATLVTTHGGDPEKALSLLRSLRSLMVPIGDDVYGEYEAEARRRLAARDPEDWPILASALALDCPIWTGRHGLFRVWCSHVDVGPRPDVSAGVSVFSESPARGSPQIKNNLECKDNESGLQKVGLAGCPLELERASWLALERVGPRWLRWQPGQPYRRRGARRLRRLAEGTR